MDSRRARVRPMPSTMLIGVAFLACLLTVPLAGGRLVALADVALRAGWLLPLAIAAQVLVITLVPGGDQDLHRAIHLGSYLLVAAFVVANRQIRFLWLVALGGALNLVAIAANGGVMPADAGALRTAGLVQDPASFTNSTTLAHPHVAFLGDVFAIPASWPVSNVFSAGDVLIVTGSALVLHALTGSRLLRGRRRRDYDARPTTRKATEARSVTARTIGGHLGASSDSQRR